LHRNTRQIAFPNPLTRPYFLSACTAYSLQLGSKRHVGGKIGEMKRR